MDEKIINDLKDGEILTLDQLFSDSLKESLGFPVLEYSMIAAALPSVFKTDEKGGGIYSTFFDENNNLIVNDRTVDLVVDNLENLNQRIQQEISKQNNDKMGKLHHNLTEKIGFEYHLKNIENKIKKAEKDDYRTFTYLVLVICAMRRQNQKKNIFKPLASQPNGTNFRFHAISESTSMFFKWLETNIRLGKYGLAGSTAFIADYFCEEAIMKFKKFVEYNSDNVQYIMINFLPYFPQYIQNWVASEILKGRKVEDYANFEAFRSKTLNEEKVTNVISWELIVDYNLGKLVLLIIPSLLVGELLGSGGISKFIESK